MSTKKKESTVTESPENGNKIDPTNRFAGFVVEEGGTSFNTASESEWEDKSLPPLIKAKDFKPGSVLIGTIVELTATEIPDTKGKRGCLVVLKTANGRCSIPATSVIERALNIKGIATGEPTTEYIGRDIMLRSTGAHKTAKKGMRDFWGFDVKIKKA